MNKNIESFYGTFSRQFSLTKWYLNLSYAILSKREMISGTYPVLKSFWGFWIFWSLVLPNNIWQFGLPPWSPSIWISKFHPDRSLSPGTWSPLFVPVAQGSCFNEQPHRYGDHHSYSSSDKTVVLYLDGSQTVVRSNVDMVRKKSWNVFNGILLDQKHFHEHMRSVVPEAGITGRDK